MNKSVRTSSFTLIVSFLCAALVGAALLPLLPVRLYPSRVNPSLTVSFSLPNSSARVIEMEVTSKLEAMLARMKGVRSISSRSYNGSGSISVSLDKHANIEAIRFEAATIVRQAWPELPDGTSYPQVRVNSPGDNAQRPFLTYTLNASAPPALIQQYAEEHIQPALARIKGVYQVSVSGAMPMEWQLEYDPHQLVTLGLTPGDIQSAVSGHFRTEHVGDLVVRSHTDDATGFPIDEITVKNRDGRLIRLDELVTVRHTEAPPQSYYRINGLNSIYLSVTAEETANQLALGEKVRMVMDALKTDMPRGYEVYISYDATEQIEEELEKIYFRSGLTVLILLLFVLILTRRWRYMVLVTVSLAVNLLVAVVAYYLLGIEIQLYTLAGITISLNLIIDNTIVMADHLLHRHNLKAYLSILTATLTTICALGVVLFLDEGLRASLEDFSWVVIINLAVSLLIALFFVPSLMDKLGMMKATSDKLQATSDKKVQSLKFKELNTQNSALDNESSSTRRLVNLSTKKCSRKRMAVSFTRIYGHIIRFVCRHRVIACTLLVLAFGLPVFLLPEKMEDDEGWHGLYNRTLGSDYYKEKVRPIVNMALGGTWRLFVEKVYNGSYFDDERETVLHVTATLPNGSTLEQMNTLVKRMEGYLVDKIQVDKLTRPSGTAEVDKIQVDKLTRPSGTAEVDKIQVDKLTRPSGTAEVDKIQVDKLTRPSGTDSWSTHQLVNSSTETSISQFHTRISSPYQASIDIYFPKEHQHGSFPYQLKADLTARALELGGGSWSIYGLEDQGFNNSVRESAGSYRVRLTGYNYDELYQYAEALRDSLLTHRRVKEVIINSSFSWYKDDYRELHFNLREGRLAESDLTPMELYASMRNIFARNLSCGTVRAADGSYENVRLTSSRAGEYDNWQLQQQPFRSGGKEFKLHSLADIGIYQQAPEVVKNNQEYTLCLQYEYIGAYQMGTKMLDRVLETFNESLPPGYKARSEMGGGRWSNEDNSQYLLLLLVAAVIFVVTSILFNSLRRPFAILFLIPISYIGLFLTFWLFELNFDQGGFAAFILLCGITVNAGIYLLDEYADIRKARPALSPVRAYLKAWNVKIVPILLTILSTILGFIPFMVGTGKEAFWFPLAAGTVGGLIMSLVGLCLFLPLFCLPKSHE